MNKKLEDTLTRWVKLYYWCLLGPDLLKRDQCDDMTEQQYGLRILKPLFLITQKTVTLVGPYSITCDVVST